MDRGGVQLWVLLARDTATSPWTDHCSYCNCWRMTTLLIPRWAILILWILLEILDWRTSLEKLITLTFLQSHDVLNMSQPKRVRRGVGLGKLNWKRLEIYWTLNRVSLPKFKTLILHMHICFQRGTCTLARCSFRERWRILLQVQYTVPSEQALNVNMIEKLSLPKGRYAKGYTAANNKRAIRKKARRFVVRHGVHFCKKKKSEGWD